MPAKIELFPRNSLFLSTKLIQLLKTLSKKELQGFEDFMQALYSKERIARTTLLYLKDLYPGFVASDLARWGDAYRIIFKEEAKQKKDLKNLQNSFSDLYQYLQEYLVWKKSKQRNFEGDLLRLQVLKERKLEKEYRNRVEVLKKRIHKSSEKDMWYYLSLMQLNTLQYYGTEQERLSTKNDKVVAIMDNLDLFYIHAKFRFGAEFLNRKSILKENLSIPLLDEVRVLYQTKKATPIADLYLAFIELSQDESEDNYFNLKKKFWKYNFQNSRDQAIILFYLINYAARHTRQKEIYFSKEAFALYKFGLKNELFTLAGHFPTEPFLNIVNVACTLKSYAWAKVFILEWGVYLKEERESTIQLALARLAFARKQYELVIELLSLLVFKNDVYTLQTKLLQLRSFYALQESEKMLLRLCVNLEGFLNRNKTFNENVLLGAKNFIKLFRMLLKGKERGKIELSLEKLKIIIARDWLVQEIEQLSP